MSASLEVDVPENAVLSDWIAVFCWLPADGGKPRMAIQCVEGLDESQKLGMLLQVLDRTRDQAREDWNEA